MVTHLRCMLYFELAVPCRLVRRNLDEGGSLVRRMVEKFSTPLCGTRTIIQRYLECPLILFPNQITSDC